MNRLYRTKFKPKASSSKDFELCKNYCEYAAKFITERCNLVIPWDAYSSFSKDAFSKFGEA